MILILSTIILWLVIGFITGGFFLASTHRQFPDLADIFWIGDKMIARFFILLGPFGALCLLISATEGYSHGWINPFTKNPPE